MDENSEFFHTFSPIVKVWVPNIQLKRQAILTFVVLLELLRYDS